MFEKLNKINAKPALYGFYTAADMWNDPYISTQMLEFHLSDSTELASRNCAFIERSVEWIAGRFELGEGSAVADFGCGPGLYASRFAERGINVTGVDFSENSIRYARAQAEEKGLEIDYRNQDYLEFRAGKKYDLVTMIYCDFCALNPEQRRTLLARYYDALSEGGSLLLDVCSMAQYNKVAEMSELAFRQMGDFWASGDYYGFLNTFKYEEQKVVLNKHTIVEPERTRTIYNWLKHFSLEELRRELAQSGFEVVEHYANVAGDPYSEEATEIAVIARKV